MKKLYTLIIFATIIFNLQGQANIQKIDLNNYKNPDYHYKSLGFGFKIYGDNNFTKVTLENNNNSLTKEESRTGTSLGITLHNTIYKNNQKTQYYRNIYSNTDLRYSTFSKNDNSVKESNWQVNNFVDYESTYRYYLKNKFFVENDFSLLVSSYIFSEDNNDYYDHKIKLSIPLSIGKGRIEVISNAWKSYLILQELNKYNLLQSEKEITEDDIFKMADYITTRSYTREFDYREKYKKTLVGYTNNFLKDIAATNDPFYYAILYDIWNFSIHRVRVTGSAFSLGIEPVLNYQSIQISDLDNRQFSFSLFPFIKAEYHKAINIKWQLDLEGKVSAGISDFYKSINETKQDDAGEYKIDSRISAELGYYPNTRTYFTTKINLYALVREPYKNDLEKTDYKTGFKWQNNVYYYFSPKLRISGRFELLDNYDYNSFNVVHVNKRNRLRFLYSAGFNYYLY